MRYFLLLLFTVTFFTTSELSAQWIHTDGPYGYLQLADLQQQDSVLYAGTSCGLFAKSPSQDRWQRLTNNHRPRLFFKGDSLFTSFYHGLGIIDLNDPELEQHGDHFRGFPFLNGPAFAFHDSLMFITSYYGIHLSHDLGDSTYLYIEGLPVDTALLTNGDTIFSLQNPDIITTSTYAFCSTEKGVFRSDYSLSGWEKKNDGIDGEIIWKLYSFDTVLYALSRDTLFESTDNGDSWFSLLGSESVLSGFGRSGNTLYVAADTLGVLFSPDNGVSWGTINVGIEGKPVRFVEASGTDLYCYIFPEGIYKWNGNQWNPEPVDGMFCPSLQGLESTSNELVINDWNTVYTLEIDDTWKNISPQDTTDWYYGIHEAFGDTLIIPGYRSASGFRIDSTTFFYRTSDTASWKSLPTPGANTWNSSGVQIKLRYFNNTLYAFDDYFIFSSTDWGQHWADITPSRIFCSGGINDIIYFEDTLYASTCLSHQFFVYDPHSNTWRRDFSRGSRIGEPLDFMLRDTVLFVQTWEKIYRRSKNDSEWQEVNQNGLPVTYDEAWVNSEHYLFISAYGGIFYTSDYGDTWNAFNPALPKGAYIKDLEVFRDTLYVGTEEHGVYKHALPEPPVFLPEFPNQNQLVKVFPNPAQDYISIEIQGSEMGRMELYDISGKLTLRKDFKTSAKIPLPDMKSGSYILSIQYKERLYYEKLVVE